MVMIMQNDIIKEILKKLLKSLMKAEQLIKSKEFAELKAYMEEVLCLNK